MVLEDSRGDKIELKGVPFKHVAMVLPSGTQAPKARLAQKAHKQLILNKTHKQNRKNEKIHKHVIV